jgi:hypothetical protein
MQLQNVCTSIFQLRTLASVPADFFGPSLVYTSSNGTAMDEIIGDSDEDQFANG